MPIGEAHKSGSTFTGLCEYVLAQGIYSIHNNEKKPEIVFNNFIYGTEYLDIGKQFKDQANENRKVSKPVMHLTVNFKANDHISKLQQEEFVKRILKEMGVNDANHQYLVVRHQDKHPHYHLIINRVGFDGKTLSDSNSKLRIGTACDKIEKEMGLDNYLAETRAFVYDKETNSYTENKNRQINKGLTVVKPTRNRAIGVQEKKDFIQTQTLKLLKNPQVHSLDILQIELKKKNINFSFSVNKNNQVAVAFRYDGLAVKGMQISLKGNLIRDQLAMNKTAVDKFNNKAVLLQNIEEIKLRFKTSIEQITQYYNAGTVRDFKEVFKQNGIIYNDDYIRYKNLSVEMIILKEFKMQCDSKLQTAKTNYDSRMKAFEKLQQTEFKKGFLGILTPEQKKFNADLVLKQTNSQKPTLQVDINPHDFLKTMETQFVNIYRNVDDQRIVRNNAYFVHESINLNEVKIPIISVKESSQQVLYNNKLNVSTQENDEDLEQKKKKRFRR